MFYAVSCGEALHIIPADSHIVTLADELTVQGREDHNYGPADWDLVLWADTKDELYAMVGRMKLAKRLQD